MRHGYLIKAASVLAALFLVAACSEEPPATTAADTGGGGAQATEQQAPQVATQPSGPEPGTQEHFVLNVGDRVFFDFDKYDLKSEAQETLRLQAAYLNRFPSKTVVIEGHADERGTREYNLGLGERRANSAKEYLISLGIDPSRIETISYGKERPVALGSNESAWAQNRRAVTVIAN